MARYVCPSCGEVFSDTDAIEFTGCMPARHAGVVCCPACGCEFPDIPEEETESNRGEEE